MKFSGKGPVIHDVLAGRVNVDGQMYRMFNDQAADWPWPEDSANEPKVGAFCSSCENRFVEGQMAYQTIETGGWVCWRHIMGLTGPSRQEPES